MTLPAGNGPADKAGRLPEADFDLEKYTFDVPEAQVSQHPAGNRHDSRLLVMERKTGRITHRAFKDIGSLLPEGTLLVLNASKVFPARLPCIKEETHGRAEFLILTPLAFIRPDESDGQWSSAEIRGLVKPARSLKPGHSLRCGDDLRLRLTAKEPSGEVRARLLWRHDLKKVLEKQGRMPLPPYIKRDDCQEDRSRYQTVYARDDKCGSAAAPTAGLHFTPEILASLDSKGIETAEVTLFVGQGTFRPIRCRDIRSHRMHEEYYEIPETCAQAVRRAKADGRPVAAVGTTSVRTLEGAFRQHGEIKACSGTTDLFISPGFQFQVVDHLLTNFHLPKSTLVIMVSAFAGRRRILEAYAEAVRRGYNFFSYGDAMLIL